MKSQYEIGMLIKSGDTLGVIAGVLFAKDYVKYMLEDDTFIHECDVDAAYTPVKSKIVAKPKAAGKTTKAKKKAASPKTEAEIDSTESAPISH